MLWFTILIHALSDHLAVAYDMLTVYIRCLPIFLQRSCPIFWHRFSSPCLSLSAHSIPFLASRLLSSPLVSSPRVSSPVISSNIRCVLCLLSHLLYPLVLPDVLVFLIRPFHLLLLNFLSVHLSSYLFVRSSCHLCSIIPHPLFAPHCFLLLLIMCEHMHGIMWPLCVVVRVAMSVVLCGRS